MNTKGYEAPPITEAVIEVRFCKSLDDKQMKRLCKKLSESYQHKADINHVDLAVDVGAKTVKDTSSSVQYRFATEDQTEIFILGADSLIVSQLAPYCGWSGFLDRFKRDFDSTLSCSSYREIKRVGVRYINRIDLPVEDGKVEHEKYLNVYVFLPDFFDPVDYFATQIIKRFNDSGFVLRLNCGLVESPLDKHLSILFDQDIYKDSDLPKPNMDEVVALLNSIREKKNKVFEESITDKARGLFNG